MSEICSLFKVYSGFFMIYLKFFTFLLISFIVTSVISGAEMLNATFQVARPTKKPLLVDGILSKDEWKAAEKYTTYYVYMDSVGHPGKLKTESRILYDQNGVYLGINNYCDDPNKIKRSITTNFQKNIWRDDCAEIYFNASADRVSYHRFAINSNSMKHCMLRDATLIVRDFMAPGTQIKCLTGKDRWTLEAFFPWADLGGIARIGDLWMFCHVRYAWPDNKFTGVASSVGGAGSHPENFGYLYFALDSEKLSPATIGQILSKKLPVPWGTALKRNMVFDLGGGVKIEPFTRVQQRVVAECDKKLADLGEEFSKRSIDSKELTKLQQVRDTAVALIKDNPLQAIISLTGLNADLNDLQWLIKLEDKFNKIK
jgi:hypothetical protein